MFTQCDKYLTIDRYFLLCFVLFSLYKTQSIVQIIHVLCTLSKQSITRKNHTSSEGKDRSRNFQQNKTTHKRPIYIAYCSISCRFDVHIRSQDFHDLLNVVHISTTANMSSNLVVLNLMEFDHEFRIYFRILLLNTTLY